jgi:predicted nucleotide-binding protein
MSLTKQEALQKLNQIVSRILQLEGQKRFSADFQKWKHDVHALLKHVFPNDREYVKQFDDIRFSPGVTYAGQPDTDFQESYVSGLRSARAMLESRIDEITQFWQEPEPMPQSGVEVLSRAEARIEGLSRIAREYGGTPRSSPEHPELVFVIHGRQLLADFHAFLRSLGLKPLEWSQARKLTNKTNPFTWEIVDKALKEAGAIVALFTPDDEARLRPQLLRETDSSLERQSMSQPRQNVLFEAGVAYGRDPDRTVLIRVGAQRPMSDLAGHHILQLDDSPESRQAVADALRTAGCPVDTTGSEWFKAGMFALPART